jgi:hypothetical protein
MTSFTNRIHNWFRYPKQVREAAQQMWDAVQRGFVFEVPLSLDRHDPAMQAVFLMQSAHPEVKLGVRQSRSLIVSHESRHNISSDVRQLLLKGGQMYNPEEFRAGIEAMLAGHESFLREQSLDPTEMEREAKEAEMKLHAIEVSGTAKETSPEAPVAAPAPEASVAPVAPEATP